ncbi:MAG: XdhC/CoxI family protein [Acetobacter papayae]|uniref:XdhC family protein n=2 Tax=Acetobacter papayae TaxID=1076592 RepID=UPI0039E9CD91
MTVSPPHPPEEMQKTAQHTLDHALHWVRQGQAVAVATVTGTWGSSPRPAGSCMVMAESGRVEGSVSGGCVESDVMHNALRIMAGDAPEVLDYGVSSARAWEVGLACGGRLEVLVEAVRSPACPTGTWPMEILEQLCALMAARRPAVLLRTLDATQHRVLATRADAALEHPAHDEALGRAALHALATGRGLLTPDSAGQNWFVQPLLPPPRLLIVGAVHIAQHLARLAALTGFDPIVVDPREALATTERFPGLEPGRTLITEWPDEALPALGIDSTTALVTLTHDAKLDDPTLETALGSPAFYIGALGSRKTQASRLERLQQLGYAPEALARIRGPVGLAIGAVGAEEIALSILADIVAVRRNGPLATRRGWDNP